MKSHHHLLIFIPAILLLVLMIGFRVYQYNLLVETSQPESTEDRGQIQIPIFPQDPIIGERKAPITIVAFEDLGCEGCRDQDELLSQVIERHPGQVKIIWKALPVTTIPYPSKTAHEYAFCAHKQGKFENFKHFAFANTRELSPEIVKVIAQESGLDMEDLDTCLASGEPVIHEQQNTAVAEALRIQAVPTFFINNVQIDHPTTVAGWETLLGLSL